MNITHIHNTQEIEQFDPELFKLREKTVISDWQKKMEEFEGVLKGYRCFVVYKPAYMHIHGDTIPEHFDSLITVPSSQQTDGLIEAFIKILADDERTRCPGIKTGSYKDTPIKEVKAIELDPLLFLETAASVLLMGYPIKAVSIIRDTNDKKKALFKPVTFKGGVLWNENMGKLAYDWEKTIDRVFKKEIMKIRQRT